MLTDKTEPGLVTFYDIRRFRPGNGAGLFLQPRSLPAQGGKVSIKGMPLLAIGSSFHCIWSYYHVCDIACRTSDIFYPFYLIVEWG